MASYRENCVPCGLWRSSRAVCVGGEGGSGLGIFLLGEGLGEEEECHLRPFVGRAGNLLNRCLLQAGLHRAEVRISNSVRCRPTDPRTGKNRAPTAAELAHCRPWLDDEIAQVRPRVIVALGRSAMWAALDPSFPAGGVGENQGRTLWSERYGCWVVCTFHPAYVLRAPSEELWLVLDLILAKEIAATGRPREPLRAEYRAVRTLGDAEEMRDDVLRAGRIAWDWETVPDAHGSAVHLTQSEGFCVSFATDRRDNFAWVVPRYGQERSLLWSDANRRRLDRDFLAPILLSLIPKVGHNAPFDMCVGETTLGVETAAVEDDTMVLHHAVCNHLGERAHGLKRLSVLYTAYGRYDDPLDAWLVEHGYVKNGKPDGGQIWRAPNDIVWPYNGTDSVVTLALLPILLEKLRSEGLETWYRQERMPFILNYKEADRAGVRIDLGRARGLTQEIALAMDLTANRLAQVAGRTINPNSPQQVTQYLFDERGLPVVGWTEKGHPSTREECLKEVAHLDPAPALILHYRSYSKLKGAWMENKDGSGGLLTVVDADGRARMNTITCAVETFRLATRKPFPIHTLPRPLLLWSCPAGHGHYLFERCCPAAVSVTLSIRSLLIPDDGCRIVQVDWAQQEMALAAIASGQADLEAAMLDRREDAHDYIMEHVGGRRREEFGRWTTDRLPRNPETDWEFFSDDAATEYKNLRADYKRIGFQILYRGGPKKLARSLTVRDPAHPERDRVVDEYEAATVIESFYDRLPMIRRWQYDIIKRLRATGRVVGLFGTYRILPGIYSDDRYDQYEAERAATNFPFQNCGAHLLMRAWNEICAAWAGDLPLRAPFPGRLLFSCHDELVSQVREDLVDEGVATMRRIMERPHRELVGGCGIPRGIHTDAKVTDAWGGLPGGLLAVGSGKRVAYRNPGL